MLSMRPSPLRDDGRSLSFRDERYWMLWLRSMASANVSMDALERICNALEWDPFELPLRELDTLPDGVRTLLLAELTHMQHLVQTAISWVQTLDAAMVRRASQPDATSNPATWPDDLPPTPRPRGRPRGRREHQGGPLPDDE